MRISVRAESKHGKRLNPRKADLHRWRETFAEKLRDRGVEAEATRQATRVRNRNYDPLWRIKAGEEGRLRTARAPTRLGPSAIASRTRWTMSITNDTITRKDEQDASAHGALLLRVDWQ